MRDDVSTRLDLNNQTEKRKISSRVPACGICIANSLNRSIYLFLIYVLNALDRSGGRWVLFACRSRPV